MPLFALLLLFVGSLAPDPPTVVYLVRHAEKAAVPGADPPLSEAGQARARVLAGQIGEVDAVFVTSFRRTQETAAPLAERLGLPLVVVDARHGVDSLASQTAGAVRELGSGRRVLVVGHSNTRGAVVEALGGPEIPPICEAEYSRLLVLTLSDPPVLETQRYGAEDAPCAE